MRLKLKYWHPYFDRHGRLRHYFRKVGQRQIPLPGLPFSEEFLSAYREAAAGLTAKPLGAKLIKAGSVKQLVNTYFHSVTFADLAAETQRTRKNILIKFEREHGDKRAAMLKREHIAAMFKEKSAKRFLAINWLKTLRALCKFAVDEGLLKTDPTDGIKNLSGATAGYRTWDESDVAKYEAKHPLGTRERLALELLACTAQRRSDVVKMGRQHMRKAVIEGREWLVIDVRQQKTGTPLAIPILPQLEAAIDAMLSKDNLTLLTTVRGKPFSPEAFTNWFRQCCNAAGLPRGTSAHGLRKIALKRFAEAGCSAHQIAAISGHKSLREIERYTKAAEQERLARDAMIMLIKGKERRTGGG
jgi:integrase